LTVVKNGGIFASGQALIAGNSHSYWQNQQQRQAGKGPVFIAINCWDWYEYSVTLNSCTKDFIL
jgi:hypothetical protein